MELLEQAGYTKDADGYYLTLTLDVFSGGTYADCGKVIQANLKEAGINLQLNVMEMAAWAEKISAGNYQLGMMAGYQGPDPDAMAKRIGTGAVMNYSQYSNEKVDELLAQARTLTTHEERGACYKEVQAILAELSAILADEHLLMDVIKTEITAIRDKFGDDRKTELTTLEGEIDVADLIQEEDMVVTLTHQGYVKRIAKSTYRAQHRGIKLNLITGGFFLCDQLCDFLIFHRGQRSMVDLASLELGTCLFQVLGAQEAAHKVITER